MAKAIIIGQDGNGRWWAFGTAAGGCFPDREAAERRMQQLKPTIQGMPLLVLDVLATNKGGMKQ